MTAAALADALFAARTAGRRPVAFDRDTSGLTMDAAYAVQADLLDRLAAADGGRIVGRKIGCTNEIARRMLGIDGPFHGALRSTRVYASPYRIAATELPFILTEPEFALRLGRDLAPRGTPYTAAEMADAVEAVVPAIEIVSSGYADWTKVGPAALVADNGSSYGWVHGAATTDWRVEELTGQTVRLSSNGRTVAEGSGANVEGGPLGVLAWLASRVALKAGEVVSTGTTTDVLIAKAGETVTADFGRFGAVTLEVV